MHRSTQLTKSNDLKACNIERPDKRKKGKRQRDFLTSNFLSQTRCDTKSISKLKIQTEIRRGKSKS